MRKRSEVHKNEKDDRKIDQIVQTLLDVDWVEKLNNLDASTGFNYFHT